MRFAKNCMSSGEGIPAGSLSPTISAYSYLIFTGRPNYSGDKALYLPLPRQPRYGCHEQRCRDGRDIMKRINKYITDAGYCSRREADAYISQGRVTINGREAALGDSAGEGDVVEVDGERVGAKARKAVYIACHKPVGITCTSEKSDRTNIVDFLGYKERIFPVGRLDKDSEGLILLTNDGDIVNKILRAGNNNPKEYIVTVDRPITGDFLSRMADGVHILGTRTKPCKIFRRGDTTFVIHLTQGLNRQIRRMCQALGYKVVRLRRVKVLNIPLGDLEPGRWRYLTADETREMHLLLAGSSGTEEASNERKASSPRENSKRAGSYADYRRQGKTPSRMSRAESPGRKPVSDLPGKRTTARPAASPETAKPIAKQGALVRHAAKPTAKQGGRPVAKTSPYTVSTAKRQASTAKPTARPSAGHVSKRHAGPGRKTKR